MPGRLRTVLGDIEPSTMGATLPHEHLICGCDKYWEGQDDPRADPDPEAGPTLDKLWYWQESPCANRGNLHLNNEADAIAELAPLREFGYGTLIDVSNVGLNPDVAALARISSASGIHIAAGTSYYVASSQTDEVKAVPEEEMVEQIVNDITVGIGDTGIRAGVIGEVGLSWPIDPFEERALAASVRAQQVTGAALTIHNPYFLRDVDVLVEIAQRIADLGADMDRVIMGHCDSFTRDPRFLEAAAELGCYIEFDCFGQMGYEEAVDFVYPSDEVRVDTILGMIEAGLTDRLLLSQDVFFKTSAQKYGGHGYAYVPRVIVPWLKRRGADDGAIDRILVRNPQEVFPIPA